MRFYQAWAMTIASFMLSTQAALAGSATPQVIVVPAPLAPYVDAILQGGGKSQSLLKPGQNAHHFSLSPRQAALLRNADLLVVADMSMHPALDRLRQKHPKLQVIELYRLAGANPLPYPKDNPWLRAQKEANAALDSHENDHAHAHAHDHAAEETLRDPHLWLDPERMAAIAVPLAEAMSRALPESEKTMRLNAQSVAAHLRNEVAPAIAALLKQPAPTSHRIETQTIPFVTYHAAYQYFLTRFGIDRHGELLQRPEESLGAKSKAELLSQADNVSIRCLIAEQESPLVKRIASGSQARIVLLSPEQLPTETIIAPAAWIQNDYDRFLYQTAKSFAECLKE
jgi:zinc transport system substrate-binding protein